MLFKRIKRLLSHDQNVGFSEANDDASIIEASRCKENCSTYNLPCHSIGTQSGIINCHVTGKLNTCCRELIQLTVQTEDLKERIEALSNKKYNITDHVYIRKVTNDIKQGLAEAEFLVVINDYIKSLELELQNNKRMVKAFSCKNKNLQKRVLHKHQEWLSRIHECEVLQRQLEAWRFALSLQDPSYSTFQQLITNPVENQIRGNKNESDVPANSSNLPWIWLAEDKCEFLAKVDKLIVDGHLSRAVQITLAAFDLHKLYPASQRHRCVSYYAVELTRALDYLSDLSLKCHQNKAVKLALVCANHAVRLLLSINFSRSVKSEPNPSEDFNFSVLIRTRLTSAMMQETEWATLMEATRKLIQVFWLTGRFDEVIALLFATVGARRDLVGPEAKQETWKGFSQLDCLLSGGLCLFTGQITQTSFITYGREDQIGLWFTELAVCLLEASLAVSISRCTDQSSHELNDSSGLESAQGPSFNLWTMTLANLARQCANIGAVYDVVLLTVRAVSILCRIEPWRTISTTSLTHLLPIVLKAEEESQDRAARQIESYDLNLYMKNIRCMELNEALETFMKELVLVCRGQKWNTAATLLEWWVTGCQLRRQNLEVRKRRGRSNLTKRERNSSGMANNLQFANGGLASLPNTTTCSASTRNKDRMIHVRFLDFLIQVQVSNSIHISSSELGQQLSQIFVGKHREGISDEILCNFSGSARDPRSACFLRNFKQITPLCMAVLEQLVAQNNCGEKLSESLFVLTSNRKLFKWWKQYIVGEKQSENVLRPQGNPFMNRTGLVSLWDDALRLVESELSATLPIRKMSKMKTNEAQSTIVSQRLSLHPLPVTHSLDSMVRSDS